ncbi:MAG: molybdopterin dinucleotide binding domain-containing protein, partial [Bacteroidota bacterium]
MEALANGGVFQTDQSVRAPGRTVRLNLAGLRFSQPKPVDSDFELVTYPSIAHYDGRGANRPWLQELPDPMTQITWDTWVEINAADAERLNIRKGDLVQILSPNGSVEVPAYVYAGVRSGTIAVPIGQGHTAFGRYAQGIGVNIISLLPPLPAAAGGPVWSGIPVRVVRRGERVRLADVAGSDYVHGRNIVQMVTVEELLRQTKELAEERPKRHGENFGKPDGPSLYP